MRKAFKSNKEFADQLDSEDPLKKFRDRFYIPPDTIYFDGNSLGLLPKEAEKSLLRVINEWKTLGIKGWYKEYNEKPWWFYGERLGELAAPLVGAQPEEIIATGTTTVNIHSLVATFYNPQGKKTKILADELNFPTDIYALQGQIKLHGLDPKEHLVLAPSEDGQFLNEKTIVDLMTDEIALILLPSALYRSGQLLDVKYLTEEAHKRNILIGWDCSHSVGAVPHFFDSWGVDFATWCSYKYLNSGPGATAFLYVNKKHFEKDPKLAGWFGYVKDKQFDMLLEFEHAKSAGGWQISSSNILCSAPLDGALKVTLEAGIEKIREKSIEMTEYLIFLVDHYLAKEFYNIMIGTPRDPTKRTGHVALEHNEASKICEFLLKKNIIVDFRPPNVVRIAPTALYNTYQEIWYTVQTIKEIISDLNNK